MALVLYDGPGGQTGEGAAAVKGTPAYESNELKAVHNKLASLTADSRLNPYIGLQNQGATCYMNSLL